MRKDNMSPILKRLDAKAFHKAARSVVKLSKVAHVHQMLGVIIVVAHASEIVRVVSHISIWHLAVALAVFGLWLTGQHDAAAELA